MSGVRKARCQELLCPFRWVDASFLVLEAEGQGRGAVGCCSVRAMDWGGLLLWLPFQINLISFGWLEPSSLHTGAEGAAAWGGRTPLVSPVCAHMGQTGLWGTGAGGSDCTMGLREPRLPGSLLHLGFSVWCSDFSLRVIWSYAGPRAQVQALGEPQPQTG